MYAEAIIIGRGVHAGTEAGNCRHWKQNSCFNCLRCRDHVLHLYFPINHGFDPFHDQNRIFAKFNQTTNALANILDDIQARLIVSLTMFAHLFQFDIVFRFIVRKGICSDSSAEWESILFVSDIADNVSVLSQI